MHDTSVDDKPHLVIGIEAEGDPTRAIREAGAVAAELSRSGEPVDLVAVERGKGGLSRYFVEETTPFYEWTWGARLKSMLRRGRA